jgi:hypothetical protein
LATVGVVGAISGVGVDVPVDTGTGGDDGGDGDGGGDGGDGGDGVVIGGPVYLIYSSGISKSQGR